MTRVLVVLRTLRRLSDTLRMAAALRALRRDIGSGELSYAAEKRLYGEVFRNYDIVDRAFEIRELRNCGRKFDLVVTDSPGIATLVARPGARVVQFTPWPPSDKRSFGLQLAERVGVRPRWPEDSWLRPPRAAIQGPIVLAPGGRQWYVEKRWPTDRWLALAGDVALRDRELHVVVGPTEIAGDDPRRWAWPRQVEFAVNRENPLVLASQLERAAALIGIDSGVTHLAGMLGVPTVGLFGATQVLWAPVGPHVAVVHGSDMAAIEAGAVAAALRQRLAADVPPGVNAGSGCKQTERAAGE